MKNRYEGFGVTQAKHPTMLSVMLAVPNTPRAVEWYQAALDARVLWSLGSVAGLEIDGAPFFLHEPVKGKFASPGEIGRVTARIELFVDNPDAVIKRAVDAGAIGEEVRDYKVSWGIHRQGGFVDPFGHHWLVGDKSPLTEFNGSNIAK